MPKGRGRVLEGDKWWVWGQCSQVGNGIEDGPCWYIL